MVSFAVLHQTPQGLLFQPTLPIATNPTMGSPLDSDPNRFPPIVVNLALLDNINLLIYGVSL